MISLYTCSMCLVVANADLLHQQKEGKSAPPPVVGAMVVLAQPYESRHLPPFDAPFMDQKSNQIKFSQTTKVRKSNRKWCAFMPSSPKCFEHVHATSASMIDSQDR